MNEGPLILPSLFANEIISRLNLLTGCAYAIASSTAYFVHVEEYGGRAEV